MRNFASIRSCIEKIKDVEQSTDKLNPNKFSAAFQISKLWPAESTIRIYIGNGSDTIGKTPLQVLESNNLPIDPLQYRIDDMSVSDMIKTIVFQRFQPLVNLTFVFVDQETQSDVRISFDPEGGAWSAVGIDCKTTVGPTMNLGWFDVPTTIHEFGHVLGMIHEHQSPISNPIQWNLNAVYEWAKQTQGWDKQTTDTNIIDRYDVNSINGSTFDPDSIMLYFYPASLTVNGIGTHQNLRLSLEDMTWINKMYPTQNGITPDDFFNSIYSTSILDNRYTMIFSIFAILILMAMMFYI